MINVTKTYLPDINRYKGYIDKIYGSGQITNNGDFVRELENRLKEYLLVDNIILVSNGTLALQVAYMILGLQKEVITTPFSFVATTSSLVWQGLKPRYVDIDKHTLNIDYRKIESNINSNTSAIVATHVFGNGCEVDKIDGISKRNNIKVIYDAAHCFGVDYLGKSILSYGDISILSFHATKIFHCIEGGALIVNDKRFYNKAREMINFGFDNGKIVELGINAKMNEFQAAMGLCVLEDIDKIINNRRLVYNHYRDSLNKQSICFQLMNKNCSMNYCYFPIILDSEKELLKITSKLLDYDIIPRRYFYPSLNKLPYIDNQSVEISEDISKRILCLPIYESLSESSQDMIISIINNI